MKQPTILAAAFFALFPCFLHPLPAADEAYLNDVYEGASLTLREGDRARENFNFAAASSLYETSLWTLRTLKREYPDWRAADVQGKIDRCLQGVRELPDQYRDRFEPAERPAVRKPAPREKRAEKAPRREEIARKPKRFKGAAAPPEEEEPEAEAERPEKPEGRGSYFSILLYGAAGVVSAAGLAFILVVFLRRR